MSEFRLDFESKSAINLKLAGAHRYASDPTTDIICVSFAVGDGAIETWIRGAPCPDIIVRVVAEVWPIHAYNANFERLLWWNVLTPRYGWPRPRLEQFHCTMAAALASALPGSLEGVAAALGVPFRKDPEGYAAMLRMSRPRKPRSGEDPAVIYWGGRDGDPDLVCRYNRGDVEQERAVRRLVPPLPPNEQTVWQLDAAINDRGFGADLEFAAAAISIVHKEQTAINAEIAELTGGAIKTANQVAKIAAFARARGHQLKSLGKRSVAAVLSRGNPDADVRRLFELRREGARASVRKLDALFTHAGVDGRIRGALQYHGAATGRWAGRGFQPHNLKRIEIDNFDVDAAVDAVLARDLDRVRAFGQPLTVIGDLMRATICAPRGQVLICGDFSTIEARVLAWYAGETWKLDAFRKFDVTGDPTLDPYLVAAARVLRRPIAPDDEIGRHFGKTNELSFGFGGALGAWRKFDDSDAHSDADVERYKNEWRRAHPATVQFWHALERHIKKAIRTGQRVVFGALAFEYDNATLTITLPSGRRITYPDARLEPGKFKDTTEIVFKDNERGAWNDKRAWFGIFVENVVSGTARDLLVAAMWRVEAAGYPITLHVHDEIICETVEGFGSVEEFHRLLTAAPDWATGLPIAAKVRIGRRYSKSKSKSKPDTVIELERSALETVDVEDKVFADDF